MSIKTLPGYIYLDLEHPLVAWECYRGALISPYMKPLNNVYGTSMLIANIINSGNNINLANEFLFEHVRAKDFPTAVSRLACIYAFEDKTLAHAAENWGSHFKYKDGLIEVGIGANHLTRVDANWITQAERDEKGLITKEYVPSIRKYWSGEPYNSKPHWELLIDGHAVVWGTTQRTKAYDLIKEQMPKTLGLLELSRIAESMGFNLGHIHPAIYKINQQDYKLVYLGDMNDLNKNPEIFIKSLMQYSGPINHQDCATLFDKNGNMNCTVPDLRKYEKKFSLSTYTFA